MTLDEFKDEMYLAYCAGAADEYYGEREHFPCNVRLGHSADYTTFWLLVLAAEGKL